MNARSHPEARAAPVPSGPSTWAATNPRAPLRMRRLDALDATSEAHKRCEICDEQRERNERNDREERNATDRLACGAQRFRGIHSRCRRNSRDKAGCHAVDVWILVPER